MLTETVDKINKIHESRCITCSSFKSHQKCINTVYGYMCWSFSSNGYQQASDEQIIKNLIEKFGEAVKERDKALIALGRKHL